MSSYLTQKFNVPPPDDDASRNDSISDNLEADDDTYSRYYNRDKSVASLPSNVLRSYENSSIVLGHGETCLWKAKSGLYFPVMVIATTFQQALSNLHYKIMLASEGMYMENVKHSELFIEPASETK